MEIFLAFTIAGSFIWSAALAFAGFALGAGYEIVDRVLDPVAWVVIAGALAMYLYRVIKGTGGGKGTKTRSRIAGCPCLAGGMTDTFRSSPKLYGHS